MIPTPRRAICIAGALLLVERTVSVPVYTFSRVGLEGDLHRDRLARRQDLVLDRRLRENGAVRNATLHDLEV